MPGAFCPEPFIPEQPSPEPVSPSTPKIFTPYPPLPDPFTLIRVHSVPVDDYTRRTREKGVMIIELTVQAHRLLDGSDDHEEDEANTVINCLLDGDDSDGDTSEHNDGKDVYDNSFINSLLNDDDSDRDTSEYNNDKVMY